MFIRAGLCPTSKEIHVKQGAGGYFHISSFNGRIIHFQGKSITILRDFVEISTLFFYFTCISWEVGYSPALINISTFVAKRVITRFLGKFCCQYLVDKVLCGRYLGIFF